MELPFEPTSEACNRRERITVCINGRAVTGYAAWYPQMGGYCGKALAVPNDPESRGCVDVFVWHDGEFPFCGSEQAPREIHHCDASQFAEFSTFLRAVSGSPVDAPRLVGASAFPDVGERVRVYRIRNPTGVDYIARSWGEAMHFMAGEWGREDEQIEPGDSWSIDVELWTPFDLGALPSWQP